MGLKREELIKGCFASAADNEPLFVLRSTDPRAPNVVREWARQYHAAKIADRVSVPAHLDADEAIAFEAETERMRVKHREALGVADRMEAYREALG